MEKGFGRATPQDVSGDLTKQLLMPVERLISEEEKALYIKSHANYDPGEQRRHAPHARAPKPRAARTRPDAPRLRVRRTP